MTRSVVLIILGSFLLTFVLLAPAITQIPNLTEENWKTYALARTLWVFTLTTLGLWAIAFDFIKGKLAQLKWGGLFVLIGALAAFYPGGFQLINGPKDVSGSILNIGFSKKRPAHGLQKYEARHVPLKVDRLHFELAEGNIVTIRLIRKDTKTILSLQQSSPYQYKYVHCRYLPFLGRLLVFEPTKK